jgi:hypothetical protein
MTHSFARLVIGGLALFAGSGTLMTASTVPQPVSNVDILVGGTSQRRYLHDGRWYVEAVKGRECAIRLRNPYGVRVAVALSVDGLNTIDARHTTASDARKWVLGPYETVTISGWQTSRTEARRFEFTTEEQSYAKALGRGANLGVISAVFFRERVLTTGSETASNDARRGAPAPSAAPAPPAEGKRAQEADARSRDSEYAATGMGRPTDHAVTQVWLDLEETPAQTVNIRYEYRPQLVKLGIVPPRVPVDPLQRREQARGFEPGFSPEPPSLR